MENYNATEQQELDAIATAMKIAAFIEHNNIDISKYTMAEIMKAYLAAQLAAIEKASEQVYRNLLNGLPLA